MKTSVRKIIKFDYFTKLIFIIAIVALLLLIGILATGETSVLGIIFPVVIITIVIVVYRITKIQSILEKIKDDKVVGTVTGSMKNNGNFYLSFTYEYNDETYNKRVGLLIGPLLKIKLSKMETVNLVVVKDNPKKVYIADLYYK